jgi:hypothetical protein
VRTVITTLGLVLTGIVGGLVPMDLFGGREAGATSDITGNLVLGGTLALIGVLATITTIQRVVYVYREAKQQENQ